MSLPQASQSHESLLMQHESLHTERTYVAGDRFMPGTCWHASDISGPAAIYDASGTSLVYCSIVGIVSSSNLFMENQGDFIAGSDASVPLSDASVRFSLRRPFLPEHTVFSNDYCDTIDKVEKLFDVLPHEGKTVLPFLERIGGEVIFNFSRKIFDSLVLYGTSMYHPVGPTLLKDYVVPTDVVPYLEDLKHTHHARGVGVWTRKGMLVGHGQRNETMKDSLVQVFFNVKYNPVEGLTADFNSVSLID